MWVLKRQNTPWHQKSKSCGESHLYPPASTICLIRQHLSVQPNNLTPIGRDPRMTGEISFCAKIQFESLGYLLFTGGVTGVCVFLCYLLRSHEFCRSEPEEAEDADAGGWGLRVWRCAGSDLRWDTRRASFRPQICCLLNWSSKRMGCLQFSVIATFSPVSTTLQNALGISEYPSLSSVPCRCVSDHLGDWIIELTTSKRKSWCNFMKFPSKWNSVDPN